MSLRSSERARRESAATLAALIEGDAAPARLVFYDGDLPPSPNEPVDQQALAVLFMRTPAFHVDDSAGTLTAWPIDPRPGLLAGMPVWAQIIVTGRRGRIRHRCRPARQRRDPHSRLSDPRRRACSHHRVHHPVLISLCAARYLCAAVHLNSTFVEYVPRCGLHGRGAACKADAGADHAGIAAGTAPRGTGGNLPEFSTSALCRERGEYNTLRREISPPDCCR